MKQAGWKNNFQRFAKWLVFTSVENRKLSKREGFIEIYRGFGAEGSSDHSSSLLLFVGSLSTICMIQWSWQVNLPPPNVLPPEIRPEFLRACWGKPVATPHQLPIYVSEHVYVHGLLGLRRFHETFSAKALDGVHQESWFSVTKQPSLPETNHWEWVGHISDIVKLCRYHGSSHVWYVLFPLLCSSCKVWTCPPQKKHVRFSTTIHFCTTAFGGLLWDSSQNDEGHLRSALGLEVNIQSAPCIYIYITTHLKRILRVYTCFFFLSHTYIYIYYVAHVFKNIHTSIFLYLHVLIYSLSFPFISTLPPHQERLVWFLSLSWHHPHVDLTLGTWRLAKDLAAEKHGRAPAAHRRGSGDTMVFATRWDISGTWNVEILPWKSTWQWNITIFDGRYIFTLLAVSQIESKRPRFQRKQSPTSLTFRCFALEMAENEWLKRFPLSSVIIFLRANMEKTTLLLYKLSIRAPALVLQSFLQIGFWSGLSFVAQQLLTAYLEH